MRRDAMHGMALLCDRLVGYQLLSCGPANVHDPSTRSMPTLLNTYSSSSVSI